MSLLSSLNKEMNRDAMKTAAFLPQKTKTTLIGTKKQLAVFC